MPGNSERRDLFGRTEAQLIASIDWQERVVQVSRAWGGNEGLATKLEEKRANLDVDRRQLAELRGEPVQRDDPIRVLAGEALRKWRHDLVRRGRAGL